MTRDELMEALLLRAAVRACEEQGEELTITATGNLIVNEGSPRQDTYVRDSLADALIALLRDLGADVPEWPSAERVAEVAAFHFHEEVLDEMRTVAERDPLAFLALLLPEQGGRDGE